MPTENRASIWFWGNEPVFWEGFSEYSVTIQGRDFQLKEVEEKLKKDIYKIRYEEEWKTKELHGWHSDADKMGGGGVGVAVEIIVYLFFPAATWILFLCAI